MDPDPASEGAPLRHAETDPADIVNESLRIVRHHPPVEGDDERSFKIRVWGTPAFFRLWTAQVVTSFGDWLGFLAIVSLAARIGGGSEGASVGFVMAARIIPGFFLAAGVGVLIDRMDRKQVMVTATWTRALVVATLPFVDSVLGLVFATLILEICTQFFAPAKEASVPGLVPKEHLTTANSLSLAAAYGTFPVAAGVFILLNRVAGWLGTDELLGFFPVSQESVAFFVQMVCFTAEGFFILGLPISKAHLEKRREEREGDDDRTIDLGAVFGEIKEGWQFIFINPVVRSVNLGLATGLIGGGMLVPLGPIFASRVLHAEDGFSVFITALGLGVAGGVVTISVLQRRLPKDKVFSSALVLAGIALFVAASMSTLLLTAIFIVVVGVCAGAVYVLGFTLLHENVDNDMRGRTFSGLYIMVRMCVLLAMTVGPFVSAALGQLPVGIPGVRLTLWLAGGIMVIAGVIATLSLRSLRNVDPTEDAVPDVRGV